MTDFDWTKLETETLGVRAGQVRTAENEHSDPMFLTSSYVFESAQDAASRFAGEIPGNIYSRFTNPTVRAFEQRLAAMEGGERCLATSSGMAAIHTLCVGLLKAGDHVVCSRNVFGNTALLFKNIMSRFGVETTFVSLDQTEQWAQACRPNTRFLYLETPSNPLGTLGDIVALAKIAHDNGSLLVVDNVYCTPVLQSPLALGADLVVHSATKYLDGQGRCVGGAIVGDDEFIETHLYPIMRTCGPSLSPFNAWVFHKGLETLGIRMERHCQNALELALWLQGQPAVSRVYYTGLIDHPQHELAKQQQRGFGGIVSFEVGNDRDDAWRVIDATRLISITANLGDVKTMITHPSTTTHGKLTEDERREAGIAPNLVRLAVGLEHLDDIKRDLAPGLQA